MSGPRGAQLYAAHGGRLHALLAAPETPEEGVSGSQLALALGLSRSDVEAMCLEAMRRGALTQTTVGSVVLYTSKSLLPLSAALSPTPGVAEHAASSKRGCGLVLTVLSLVVLVLMTLVVLLLSSEKRAPRSAAEPASIGPLQPATSDSEHAPITEVSQVALEAERRALTQRLQALIAAVTQANCEVIWLEFESCALSGQSMTQAAYRAERAELEGRLHDVNEARRRQGQELPRERE